MNLLFNVLLREFILFTEQYLYLYTYCLQLDVRQSYYTVTIECFQGLVQSNHRYISDVPHASAVATVSATVTTTGPAAAAAAAAKASVTAASSAIDSSIANNNVNNNYTQGKNNYAY